MRAKILQALIFLSILQTNSFASMNWTFRNAAVCNDINAIGLNITNKIFCESTKQFSRQSFCAEAICLIEKHPSHCDAVVYEAVNRLGLLLTQESQATIELDKAVTRYCEEIFLTREP